jgi:hypothetical protein
VILKLVGFYGHVELPRKECLFGGSLVLTLVRFIDMTRESVWAMFIPSCHYLLSFICFLYFFNDDFVLICRIIL